MLLTEQKHHVKLSAFGQRSWRQEPVGHRKFNAFFLIYAQVSQKSGGKKMYSVEEFAKRFGLNAAKGEN
jgi:hypothetical protein